MKKESELVKLLDADWNRTGALLGMQLDIENGDFEYAMQCQFDYLYWSDEFIRLYRKHSDAYWKLRLLPKGYSTTGMP